MQATDSYLNLGPGRPDLVIALTEASIDSQLRATLWRNQLTGDAERYFLLHDDPGNDAASISRSDLLEQCGGHDPFGVPDGTPYATDPRIALFNAARFSVAFTFRVGLPGGANPRVLPQPVLRLDKGSDGFDGTFCMYCWRFIIVYNEPPGPDNGGQGRWHVWDQSMPHQEWTMPVRVNLVHDMVAADRDGMSVQEVRFDFNNTQWVPGEYPVGPPTLLRVPSQVLRKQFRQLWADLARRFGEPVLKIKTRVPAGRGTQGPDGNDGFMHITDLAMRVAPYPPQTDPAVGQDDCRSLELLCAVNGRPLPPPEALQPFHWAWAGPDDVPSASGVMAVHRLVFADWLKQQLMPSIRRACIAPSARLTANWTPDWPPQLGPFSPKPALVRWDYHVDVMQEPDEVTVRPGNDPILIEVRYERIARAGCAAVHFPDFASLAIHTRHVCNVEVTPTTVVVTRLFYSDVKWQWLRQSRSLPTGVRVAARAVFDTFALTVDSRGRLSLGDPLTTFRDTAEPFSEQTFDVVSAPLLGLCNDLRNWFVAAAETPWFRAEEFERFRSFVFPGAGSFTFREARISSGGDLICYTTSAAEDLLFTWGDFPSSWDPWWDWLRVRGGWGDNGMVEDGGGGGNGGQVIDTTNDFMDDWNNDHPPPPGPPPNVFLESEMMTNYVQGTLHSPYGKFEALQTDDGHSLIFSITANSNLTVVEEASGMSLAGWTVRDISTGCVARAFPNAPSVPRVRTFGVGQSALDGTIGVAMVVYTGGTDHLFLSLGNSSSDTSWLRDPQWVRCPFDPVEGAYYAITVAGILFAETSGERSVAAQDIIVDVERVAVPRAPDDKSTDDGDKTADNKSVADRDVVRYIVNPAVPSGTRVWTRHDLPVDVEAGSYQTCVGRRASPPYEPGPAGPKYEGTYTCGLAGTSGQLVFVPLFNQWSRSPPAPAVLRLPGGRVPDAIATARNSVGSDDDLFTTTDLYVVSGDTLYCFHSRNQTHGSVGVPIKTAAVMKGTVQLTATWDVYLTIWGRTDRGDVYYLCIIRADLSRGHMAWSNPLTVATGVDHMSSYTKVTRSDPSHTIFIAAAGKLQKLSKSYTPGSPGWVSQDILVNVAAPTARARPFNSYTTTVQVADARTNAPAANTTVGIATRTRAAVYIDGRYYMLSPRPTAVTTNAAGTITVVEATRGIAGHTIVVYVPGSATEAASIDPSAKSFAKLAGLDSAAALRGATVPAQSSLVAGGLMGPSANKTTPLVDPTAADKDVQTAAKNMGALKTLYGKLNGGGGDAGGGGGGGPQGLAMGFAAQAATTTAGMGGVSGKRRMGSIRTLSSSAATTSTGGGVVQALALSATGDTAPFIDRGSGTGADTGGLGDNNQLPPEAFWYDADDLFNDLSRAKEPFVDGYHAVVEAAEDGWQLVTTLGDKVYTIALTTVEDLVKAVMVVVEAIKSKIEDIIAYIMFLLQWDDISRTKKVLHNTARIYLGHLAQDVIPSIGSTIDDGLLMAERTVAEWADLDASPGAGGGRTLSSMDWSSLGDPLGMQASLLGRSPMIGQTSASRLLSSHFQTNFGGLSLIGSTSPDVDDFDQGLIDVLLDAVEQQGVVLEKAFSDLQSLANDFSSLSIEDVLRRIAGIFVRGLLSGIRTVVDALVRVLSTVASSALNILDAKIHFPVISDILNALGVGDLSFLDLFCWIAAVAYTIVYKIAEGRPPFPDNGDTQKLIDARSWADLKAAVTGPPPPHNLAPSPFGPHLLAADDGTTPTSNGPPDPQTQALYTSCHGLSAYLTFIGNFLQVLEADSPTGQDDKYRSRASIAVALLAAGANGYAGSVAPRRPIKQPVVWGLALGSTGLAVLMKVLYSNKVQSKIAGWRSKGAGGGGTGTGTTGGGGDGNSSPKRDSRGTSAYINAALVVPSLFCTAWHFTELVALPADNDRSAAIVEEVGNLTRYVSRIAYATAVNTEGQVKMAAIALMAGATASAAGLESAQAGISL